MKTGFVYIWRDRKHGRYYIGSHWGSESDGYICSSRWMRNAYKRRPEDFTRRILYRVDSNRGDLLQEEYRWLQMIDKSQLGKKYYNLTNHLNGHWITDGQKAKTISEKLSHTMKQKHQDPEYQTIYMIGRTKAAISNTGKKRDESFRKHISEVHSNRSDETRKKISENNKRLQAEGRIGMRCKSHSEETKRKQSEAARNKPLLECPHCHKTTKVLTNFNRWHGDNCKHK